LQVGVDRRWLFRLRNHIVGGVGICEQSWFFEETGCFGEVVIENLIIEIGWVLAVEAVLVIEAHLFEYIVFFACLVLQLQAYLFFLFEFFRAFLHVL
jgi:hypothetical protein